MASWDLSGRVALITGGARGIGLDTARRLAGRGMHIALVDLDDDGVEAAAAGLGEDRAAGFAADVTDRDAIEAAVERTVERFGGLDVVIANAGVAPPTATVNTVDYDAFERTIEIDLHGVWRTVRAGLPQVIDRGGYVLVVASLYAFFNGVLAAPYAMSKAAVEQLGRALRVELAPHGASAGVAYFAFIDTEMVRDAFSRDAVDTLRGGMPAWFTRPVPVSRAGEAMALGVERRSARVAAPGWMHALLALRGLIGPFEERLGRDAAVRAAIEQAERQPQGEQVRQG